MDLYRVISSDREALAVKKNLICLPNLGERHNNYCYTGLNTFPSTEHLGSCKMFYLSLIDAVKFAKEYGYQDIIKISISDEVMIGRRGLIGVGIYKSKDRSATPYFAVECAVGFISLARYLSSDYNNYFKKKSECENLSYEERKKCGLSGNNISFDVENKIWFPIETDKITELYTIGDKRISFIMEILRCYNSNLIYADHESQTAWDDMGTILDLLGCRIIDWDQAKFIHASNYRDDYKIAKLWATIIQFNGKNLHLDSEDIGSNTNNGEATDEKSRGNAKKINMPL